MNKMMLGSLACLLASSPIYANDSIFSDNVVVTASRLAQPRENVLADVSVIDREDIERAGPSSLTELLRTLPGVEIESNGGPGMASAVHLRGTSSQSVVVLIDGLRIGSATLGTTALEEIAPDQIERIEVVRGPASSLYGADAVGGVIQIFTRQGDGSRISAAAGYGTHNTRKAAINLSGANNDTKYALNVSSLNTDGISSLRVPNGPNADRDGYRNLSVSGTLAHKIAEGHEISLQLYDSFNRADFDDDALFPAHQFMTQRGLSLTSRDQLMSNWESILKLGQGEDNLHSFGSSFGENNISTTQRQYSWQNNLTLPLGTLTLAFDRLEQHVASSTQYSKNTRDNNGWLSSYLLDHGSHAFQASLRLDDNSQFGQHTTGNISYGYRLSSYWRVSGSYGTAFRAPTFNDLYWPYEAYPCNYMDPHSPSCSYQGNPGLKPETSRNRELSITYDQGHHRVSATAYRNEISNLLVCCQGLPNDFPTNVGSATIQGLTLAYEGWFANIHARASADFQSPKDDETSLLLARRARRHTSVWLGQTWGDWELGSEVVASGVRYDDAANTRQLGGYAVVNLTADYKINSAWSVHARANNLLDKTYTLATLYGTPYNTPDANLFVGLRWQPK